MWPSSQPSITFDWGEVSLRTRQGWTLRRRSSRTRAEAAPSSMCEFSISMHLLTTNQQQQLATGSMKWKSGVSTREGYSMLSMALLPPGLLHEWRLGPFCHIHIQKAGQPHLQPCVTTLQCISWLHPLQDCILTDQLGYDVLMWDQILNPQPLQGLESP